jgi:RimJ/RimL family protein N-acetyltransferase
MESPPDPTCTIITKLPLERWQEYKELRLRALQTAPQAFGQSYEEALKHDDARWQQRLIDAAEGKSWLVFAERAGRLVGMAGAFQWPEDVEANRAMIIAVFVDLSERGNGLGERLMEVVMAQMKGAGRTSAILAVNPAQNAAVRLYERMGFVRTGIERNVMGDGAECDEVVMERVL